VKGRATAPGADRILRDFFASGRPDRLGVAVSGGSDSLALLCLLDNWRRAGGPDLSVATVDHGLRPEAAEEAAMVAGICERLGLPHRVLHWQGWEGEGNLPDRARQARYGLLADWARSEGIGTVALGHTRDDQAETFLMRLARGSGVDGLSAMAPRREALGIEWVRPLLSVRRAALRNMLQSRGVTWVEDPTNTDPASARVKARQALTLLAPLGLGTDRLADTAMQMARARVALEGAAADLARTCVRVANGDVLIDRAALAAAPKELRLRLLARAIGWIASTPYPPRLAALTEAATAVIAGKRRTLGGAILTGGAQRIRVAREYRAAQGKVAAPGAIWDARWQVTGPFAPGDEVRALGPSGLAALPGNRTAVDLPSTSLWSSPAVFREGRLIAAPLAQPGGIWHAELIKGGTDAFAATFAH